MKYYIVYSMYSVVNLFLFTEKNDWTENNDWTKNTCWTRNKKEATFFESEELAQKYLSNMYPEKDLDAYEVINENYLIIKDILE